jgi:hypothetical protein
MSDRYDDDYRRWADLFSPSEAAKVRIFDLQSQITTLATQRDALLAACQQFSRARNRPIDGTYADEIEGCLIGIDAAIRLCSPPPQQGEAAEPLPIVATDTRITD